MEKTGCQLLACFFNASKDSLFQKLSTIMGLRRIHSLFFFLFLPGIFSTPSAVAAGPPDAPGILKELSISASDTKNQTGVYTLESGGQSLVSRLWLLEHARKTVDLQYYSYSKDVTGLIASDELFRAADRGVKIRVLIDDAASRMYSHEIETLNSHANIEVRIYNAGLMLGRADRRIYRLFKNINRLLRRMHNKTFTVDGQVCITGGRNIADEYFDYDKHYNFRDRDVLLIGEAVSGVKSSFDKFWNDELTVPYAELSGKKHRQYSKRVERLHKDAAESKEFAQATRDRIGSFPEMLRSAEQEGYLVWVPQVSFVSDIPGKNEDRGRKGGVCLDSMRALLKSAKTSLDIQSPYFIVTDESLKLLRELTARGVKIRLLTNSLASTDNCESFSAYRRDRQKIMDVGVEVYEFKPDAEVRYKLMLPEVQKKINYKPVFGFHSKTIVIDGDVTVIGSYNFDPRSANYNTECFAIMRSEEVAENVLHFMEEEFQPGNAWQISKGFNPDKKAKMKKRIKARLGRLFPKKLL
jgi:phosphatidylserine/phosphatidylglycerophosphate/cardiolipin synthase-like enzyme